MMAAAVHIWYCCSYPHGLLCSMFLPRAGPPHCLLWRNDVVERVHLSLSSGGNRASIHLSGAKREQMKRAGERANGVEELWRPPCTCSCRVSSTFCAPPPPPVPLFHRRCSHEERLAQLTTDSAPEEDTRSHCALTTAPGRQSKALVGTPPHGTPFRRKRGGERERRAMDR